MRAAFSLALQGGFWLAVAVLTTASLVPVDFLPPESLNIWDKAQHAGGFAVLGLLGLLAYPRHALAVCAGLVVWGGVIELLQMATGWRYGDLADWLADAIGVGAALLAWYCLPARWARRA